VSTPGASAHSTSASAHAESPVAGAPHTLRARLREEPRRRGLLFAGACVLAVFAALGALRASLAPGPQGPVSSSYATAPQGLAAWAELDRRAGRPVVQLREPLDHARLDPAGTVVVLDPDALLRSEGLRLLAFVRAGGRLLIGGLNPRDTLPALLPNPPAWESGAAKHDLPAARAAVLAEVAEVSSAGEGEWTDTRGARTLLRAGAGGALLLERHVGRGALYLLADASPLQNRLLGAADNAQLALNLSGPARHTVVFVESLHGYGPSRGLAAIPDRWRLAFAVLALAGLLWALARARRLGPPERTPAAAPPPRGAYVEALALLLRRTGQADDLAAMFPPPGGDRR
jgi:Domain of unknown function (DUF4350)